MTNQVVDVKPNNLVVEDPKMNNLIVQDVVPNMLSQALVGAEQLYIQVLTAGMYMGIPPFTYAETGTVVSPISP